MALRLTRSEAEALARRRGQELPGPTKATTLIPKAESELEALLDLLIRALELPRPRTEYRFHLSRSWRFDRAWPDRMLAAECEGITHEGGRHQRLKGYTEDCHKYTAAALAGWRVMRFTRGMLNDGSAATYLKEAFQ